MTGTREVLVHESTQEMAETTAQRLAEAVSRAQAERGVAHVVLTGGRNGNALLAALNGVPGVDWSRLHLWWGDERFLPSGDPDRNETQAREAVLDAVPLNPAFVHAMPASDGPDGDDVDAAAFRYATELAKESPVFDVALFGVGPDTHIASLFPGLPAVQETGLTVVGVRNAPKPPPTRVTLTLPAVNKSREVWLLAAGADKADAVRSALAENADSSAVPASGARGTERTLWLLDKAAAEHVS